MRKALRFAALVAPLALGLAARGDEVVLAPNLPYTNVKVTGAKDLVVSFRVGTRQIDKPVRDVVTISIQGQNSFNEAEKLLKEGKANEALGAYAAAASAAAEPWMKQLIRYRRYQAMSRMGSMVDRSAREWLALLEEAGGNPAAVSAAIDLRPAELGRKGSGENDRAIDALRSKLSSASDKPRADAIRQFLMELYHRQGKDQEAAALAREIAGAPQTTPPENGQGKVPAPVAPSALSGQIKAAEILLRQGQAGGALAALKGNLARFSAAELPAALLLMGKAQWALYEQAGEPARKKQLLLEAGLSFMKVVAYYPAAPEAPEALYLAGRVNAAPELKNRTGAQAAYREVLSRYGQSEFAGKARAELDALGSRD